MLLVASLFSLAGLAAVADPAGARVEVNKKLLKKRLAAELRERALTPRSILTCKPQRAGRIYRCEWRATGTYTAGPSYSCGGFGRYVIKSRSWRIDRCLNVELWDLLLERGLSPKAILNGNYEDGVWKYEWRAEGTSAGDVPYRCKNVAKYDKRSREWSIGTCGNELTPAEPLMPTLAPHPVFGFNDNWTLPDVLGELDRATAIGASAVRFNMAWATVEGSRDTYRWGDYDQIYASMLREGVRPILILAYAPCWAQDEPRKCSQVGAPAANNVGEYAEFAALAAQRYPQALAIEVWNEANWTHFWRPKPDPALYSRLIRAAADAVHRTGTGVPVITAGTAPLANDSADGTAYSFDGFLRRVYQEGGIGAADAVAHHIYFGDVKDRILTLRQQVARVRAVMEAHGDSGMPLWITEVGLSSTEETDLQSQGDGLVEIYNTLRRLENIPVVIVHTFIEGQDAIQDGIDHRGVIDTQGNAKPAYCALGRVREVVPPSCSS